MKSTTYAQRGEKVVLKERINLHLGGEKQIIKQKENREQKIPDIIYVTGSATPDLAAYFPEKEPKPSHPSFTTSSDLTTPEIGTKLREMWSGAEGERW